MVGHLGRPRRLLAAPVVAVVLLVAAAAPASAHTLSGPQPSNYRTTVVGVVPAVPGVEVTVVDGGTKLQLTNRTAETVIVEGYEGEPYLRVGPDGVSENLNSAATYLNRSLRGGVVPPGVDVSPDAPPDWRRISGGDTARWHDHRAHWMGEGLPPVVAADPGAPHRISTGRIPLTVGSARSEVVVNVDWVPGPDAWPWVALALVLGIVGCAVVASPRGRRAAAGLVAVLVVVDATHAVSYALARPGSSVEAVVRILTGSFASVAVWIVAVPTVVALARGRSGGYYGAVLVGLMVALAGGMTDLDSLSRSQIPTSGPEVLSRVEVAVAIGLGFGTAIGAVVALLRGRTRRHEVPTAAGRVAALVAGLDDRELRRIAAGLDAAETLASLVPEFAGRCAADSATLAAAPVRLEVVAADAVDPHVWTIAVRDGVVAAAPGPGDGGEAACVRVSFPTFLRLVGGVTTLTAAVDAGRAETTGPPAVIETVGRRLPEAAAPPADPPVR